MQFPASAPCHRQDTVEIVYDKLSNISFLIDTGSDTLLEADLLKNFVLLVDLKNKCLVDPLTSLRAKGQISSIQFHSISTIGKISIQITVSY